MLVLQRVSPAPAVRHSILVRRSRSVETTDGEETMLGNTASRQRRTTKVFYGCAYKHANRFGHQAISKQDLRTDHFRRVQAHPFCELLFIFIRHTRSKSKQHTNAANNLTKKGK